MRVNKIIKMAIVALQLPFACQAIAQNNLIAPFSKATGESPPAPWRAAGLPKGRAPLARFDIVSLEGIKVLHMHTDKTYGTVVQDIENFVPSKNTSLKWRWRLDEPVAGANLHIKAGNDVALKVCVLFDMPTDVLPFSERAILAIARTVIDERLPAATLCYIWDVTLAAGSILNDAHTRRIKYMVLDGAGSDGSLGQWKNHERPVAQDFLKAFGQESHVVPPIEAIAVGADSDSTKGTSLAYVGDVSLVP